MKFILVSFFNTTNMGDLLISRTLEKKVRKYGTVESFDYLGTGEVKKNLNIESKKDESKSNSIKSILVKMITWFISFLKLEDFYLKHSHRRINKKIYNENFEKKILEVDSLIIGGGNMIFDLAPITLSAALFDYYVRTAKRNNKPVFAISLGIGPFQNSYQEYCAVKALSKCDYITFRDQKSLDTYNKYFPDSNASIAPDPVFQLKYSLNNEYTKSKIGLNIINPDLFPNDIPREEVISNYTELINIILEKVNEDLILFNTEQKDYDTVYEVYRNFLKNDRVHIKKINNDSDLFEIYSQLKLLIGTRMHSLIIAYSQNIPIIGLSWQQKVNAMFSLLEDNKSVFPLFEMRNNMDQILSRTVEKINSPDFLKHNEISKKLRVLDRINDEHILRIKKSN